MSSRPHPQLKPKVPSKANRARKQRARVREYRDAQQAFAAMPARESAPKTRNYHSKTLKSGTKLVGSTGTGMISTVNSSHASELLALLRVSPTISPSEPLTPTDKHGLPIVQSERKGDERVPSIPTSLELPQNKKLLQSTLKGLGLGFDRWSGKLFSYSNITYNAVAAKYIQTFASNAKYPWTFVSAYQEFSQLDSLYDETFIHYIEFHYIPRNSYQTAAYATQDGDFKNAGTCAATIAGLSHNATPYGDALSAWASMAAQTQHKIVDLGKRWTFRHTNIEKFAWDTPLGDQTTVVSTQGWCQNSLVGTNYGGFVQLATALNTGAALGIGTLLESATPGDFHIVAHISMRARG